MTVSNDQSAETVERAEEQALADRLRAAAPLLLASALPPVDNDPAADAAAVLESLAVDVAADLSNDRIWLLLTTISGAFPTRGEVDRARRQFELLDVVPLTIWLLEAGLALAVTRGERSTRLEIVDGGIIVDIDHTAKHDLHTGIQRVTRSLLPLWVKQHAVVPAAWTSASGALRPLDASELDRALRWSELSHRSTAVTAAARPGDDAAHRIIVPWRSVVVMAEVPPGEVAERVAAIGDYSGNRLVGIAYDAIPVVSADMVPVPESTKFVRYLTSIKFAAAMAGISNAAATEISGFVEALGTQGLAGPRVFEVGLPSPSHGAVRQRIIGTQIPSILIVGSHEPRKNHLAVLHSAETLWREGLQFSLTFIGGSGWGDEFPDRTEELQRAGRPIRVRRAVSEEELESAYAAASFTVFPSLHEGYGLPVAESLAHGTPVITSNFGSTAEIGLGGGTILINPRNDRSLTDAMRALLCDPEQLARLRSEIGARPVRTWQHYADELWSELVQPEMDLLNGGIDGADDVAQ